ncbi:MAG: hypothetical protein IH571_00155 [Acholeplasmataceae bacterium]|nr:hypothetical protein [Acholeplasmataceae bacterium]
MKRIFALVIMVVVALTLSACWPAEIGVETTFNANGSGTRTYIVEIMDDTLSTDPIINPDDPDEDEGKGYVINDKHITGGLPAIQTWLDENAPTFITVHDMTTDGYMRYFSFSFNFDDFDDFLDKMEQLVNLSPTMTWDDFDADEKPTFTVTGGLTKKAVFTESKNIVEASMDWAIDGIYNDIYDADDLTGWVGKADISVLANYTLMMGEQTFEELRHYDAEALDGDTNTGKIIFVESADFTLEAEFTNVGLLIGIIAGAVVVAGGLGFLGFKLLKKK